MTFIERRSAAVCASALLVVACGRASANDSRAEVKSVLTNEAPQTTTTQAHRPSAPVSADPHATVVGELKRTLVAQGSWDGKPIKDVYDETGCRTVFVTAEGSTAIDWSKVGNLAPRRVQGRDINVLPAVDGAHQLAISTRPSTDAADGVSGAIGLLASDCGALGPTGR